MSTQHDHKTTVIEVGSRFIRQKKQKPLPDIIETLQHHANAVKRIVRAVESQKTCLKVYINVLEQQLQRRADEMNEQTNKLVSLMEQFQRSITASQKQRHHEDERQPLDGHDKDEQQMEQPLENKNCTTTSIEEELIHAARQIDILEEEVQELSCATEQLCQQLFELEEEQGDLSNWDISSATINSTATILPVLVDELQVQQHSKQPIKMLDGIMKYLEGVKTEEATCDQINAVVGQHNEEEPLVENTVSMLPLQVVTTATYDGDPYASLLQFLQEVEDDVNTNVTFPLTQEQKVMRLRSHLRGRARQYFDSVPDARKQTFKAASNVLKQKFNDKLVKKIADARLTTCYQKPDESVHAFSERLMDIINIIMEGETAIEIEKMTNREFKHRLSPRLRVEVLRTSSDTYEESLGSALQFEAYLDEIRVINQQYPEQQTTIMVADVRNVQCYYCHRIGHVSRNCRQRQRNRNAQTWNDGNNYNNGEQYRHVSNNHDYQNDFGDYIDNHGNDNNDYYQDSGNSDQRDDEEQQQGPKGQRPYVRFSAETMPLFTIFILTTIVSLGQMITAS